MDAKNAATPAAQRSRSLPAAQLSRGPDRHRRAGGRRRADRPRPTSPKSCTAIRRRSGSATVNGDSLELVGNVVGSRSRLAHAFGVAPDKLLPEIQRRLKLEPELIELDQNEAPVQEVVLTGKDADLTKLPAHLQHGLRRRALHLRLDRLLHRSAQRHHQFRHAPHHAARPARGRHRPQRAERSARDLSGRGRARREAADQLCGRRASDRHAVGDHENSGRRTRPRRLAARRHAAGREVPHQRHPRAGRRRAGDRRLSRREGLCRRRKGLTANISATTAW